MLPVLDTLRTLGLEEKESTMYLTMLFVGTSPVSTLCRRVGMVRSTGHFICQQLVKKGLATVSRKENTYLFTAAPPEKILAMLSDRKRELVKAEGRMTEALEQLRAMRKQVSIVPRIHFYEGVEGILEFYRGMQDDLPKNSEILTYMQPIDRRKDLFSLRAKLEWFVEERVKKNVSCRIFMPRSKWNEEVHSWDAALHRESRLLDLFPYDSEAIEINIYGDKIGTMCVVQNTLFASVQHDATIANMHRYLFNTLWELSKQQENKTTTTTNR